MNELDEAGLKIIEWISGEIEDNSFSIEKLANSLWSALDEKSVDELKKCLEKDRTWGEIE